MLYARDVIRFEAQVPRTYRVVWADQHHIWLFDLDAERTLFSQSSREDLDARLEAREVVIVTKHRHDARHVESTLSQAQTKRRDALEKVIAPIVARAPEIFDDRVRGRAVAELDREKVCSAKTVHAALDRWWVAA